MKCDEARVRMVEELTAEQPDSVLAAHLLECDGCRADAQAVRQTWARMDAAPIPEPGPRVAARFHEALEAYQLGSRREGSRWLSGWWPVRPIWQVAVSVACLALGFFAGQAAMNRRGAEASGSEIAELRKEMSGMRQLVTLSLLQQQSAAERLRGVNWSYRAEPDDVEVLSALLRTMNQDNNVDVQLAAVDALRNFGSSAVARKGLVQSLSRQNSPLLQIAVVDLLVDLREYAARPALKRLLEAPETDTNVRKRAETALQTLIQ